MSGNKKLFGFKLPTLSGLSVNVSDSAIAFGTEN